MCFFMETRVILYPLIRLPALFPMDLLNLQSVRG